MTAAPVNAQRASAPLSSDIIVTGKRDIPDIQADRVLTADDVASYGLGSIGELLDEIADERGERRDDVVYMINGQRVSGLGDIETYPTEAINRIEVLPTGSAIHVGGSGNQKVVNITLKEQVRTYVGRASLGFATDGDFGTRNADISVTDIRRPQRINLALRLRREDGLLESDRNIVQATTAPADLGRFRSLRPELDELELRASVADQIEPGLSGLITARLFHGRSLSFLGLGTTGDRLDQRSRLSSGNVDMQLNGEVGDWLLTLYGSYGVYRRRTQTDQETAPSLPVAGVTTTRALTRNAAAEVNMTGTLLDLPAGPVSLTLRGRLGRNSINTGSDNFVQWNREIGVGIQIPIANAAKGVLLPLGELNAGLEFSHGNTSRVGSLTNMTYSLQWQPADWIRLAGSINTGRTPPNVELLAAPILATPGIRYLDPLRGETIDVIQLSGGNPSLGTQRGNKRMLSVELRPPASVPLVITADYASTRNRDIITALPPGNSLLLLAFPDRFLRDAGGRLIQVDIRPINFARQTEEQLRHGLELQIPLGDSDGLEAAAARAQENPGKRSPRTQAARLQFNLSHTIQLKSEILVRPGFDVIDLLSRDALGFSGTEQSRHQFDFTLAYAERGLGLWLTGQHRGKGFLNLISGTTPDVLRFSPLTTLSMRAFVDGQRLFPSAKWLKGARLSLSVNNLTNARQAVRDSSGNTPLLYQPAYRDPTGRIVIIEFRKSF